MRIASLVPSTTETLVALGLTDQLVARSHECDLPPQAAGLPAVTNARVDSGLPSSLAGSAAGLDVSDGHTGYSLDAAALRASAPDLVFTRSRCSGCSGDAPTRCSMPPDAAVVGSNPQTLDEVLDSIVGIATAADVGTGGRSLAARLRSRLHWVSSVVSDLASPRVAVLEWPNPVYAAGRWVPDMVEAAGGINVFGTGHEAPAVASLDDLAAARPEVVILAFAGYNLYQAQARFSELTADPRFVEATRFARTFAVDGSGYFSRPGPGLVDGVELLAWALHRSHPRLQPPVGRGAKLIEAGWVDVASLPVAVEAPV